MSHGINWGALEDRASELEEKHKELLKEYNGVVELIKEDLEEQDADSLNDHVSDITDLLRDITAIRDELDHIGDVINDAVDEDIMRRGME